MTTPPVLFVIFNRPETTRATFDTIRKAQPAKLFIAADGPRKGKTGEYERCQAARDIAINVDWECEVHTLFRNTNLGCKVAVSSAIDWFFDNVEEGIILEDDCLPEQTFFAFCAELLEKYRNDQRIGMVSGNNFQFGHRGSPYSYYFSRHAHMWGWATWRSRWQNYDVDLKLWPEIRDSHWLVDTLDDDFSVDYWSKIFENVHNGRIDTWDYQLFFFSLVQNFLNIIPVVNLVSNIGFGSDATHTTAGSIFLGLPTEPITNPLKHPPFMIRDAVADKFTETKVISDGNVRPEYLKLMKNPSERSEMYGVTTDNKSAETAPPATVEDPYDTAYRWGWNNSALRQLVYLCYKTPNLADNARRFSMSEGFKEAVSLFIALGKPPRKDFKVLDLGCGNGVATYALARVGYSVTGLDSSLGELAGLKAAAKLNGFDGAEFSLLHSTGESLDFPNDSFDIIWMREVLHHIHDLQGFMKEATRILKPGGIICCLREHVIWNESQREHFFRTHPFYHITKDEGCYYLDEYLSAFKMANLLMEKLLGPVDSVINTYPALWNEGLQFDQDAAKQRMEGNDLFSFFAKKPHQQTVTVISRGKPMETGNSVLLDSFNLQVSDVRDGQTYFQAGNDCMIGAHLQVISPEAKIVVGDRVYISAGTNLISGDMIEFGNDILVAWGCTFIDHDSYPMDAETRKTIMSGKLERLRRGDSNWDKPELTCVTRGKITIQDNAWIGMNCVILGGVTIGEGAVIGACSVVTEDVEPWTVVIGNPARRII